MGLPLCGHDTGQPEGHELTMRGECHNGLPVEVALSVYRTGESAVDHQGGERGEAGVLMMLPCSWRANVPPADAIPLLIKGE